MTLNRRLVGRLAVSVVMAVAVGAAPVSAMAAPVDGSVTAKAPKSVTGSSLTGSSLTGSSLTGSSLTGSSLTGSSLTGSSLTGSSLT